MSNVCFIPFNAMQNLLQSLFLDYLQIQLHGKHCEPLLLAHQFKWCQTTLAIALSVAS